MFKFLKKMKKILIVEDDPILRKSIADEMRDEGYTVFEARSGDEALPIAFSEKPNLIVLDLMLPDQNGMSILEEIRNDEWGRGVPVVILSNLRQGDALLEQTRKHNVFDYIEKANLSLGEVTERIRNAL